MNPRLIVRRPEFVPFAGLATWAVMAVYFAALFDVLLLALLFAAAFSLGSQFRLRNDSRFAENLSFQVLVGLGVVGVLLWITTFENHRYREIYLLFSIAVIVWRRKEVSRSVRYLTRTLTLHGKRSRGFLLAPFAVITLFVIFGSYPISMFDSLTKHIAIPTKILYSSHYDYNVVESVVFGDFALLSHMFSLFLLALGAKKGPILMVAALSGLALIFLLRILRSAGSRGRWTAALLVLVYGSTPVILQQSTMLYVDMVPLPFLLFVAGYVVSSRRDQIVANAPGLFFLLGCGFFGKQTAAYLGIPLIVVILWNLGDAVLRSECGALRALRLLGTGLLLLALPWAGPLVIIWLKTGNPVFPMANGYFQSPYFMNRSFADSFQNALGFDFGSLVSIAFHTNKNIEMAAGAFGFHVLVLPLAFLVPVFRRNRRMLLVVALALGSYLCNTQVTYNLRYYLACFILSIVPLGYAVEWSIPFIGNRRLQTLAWVTVSCLLLGPNLNYVFIEEIQPGYNTYGRFTKPRLASHDSLTIVQMQPLFDEIPDPYASVLYDSENPYRGDWRGYFSTLSWHNMFLTGLLKRGELAFGDLVYAFDYFLQSKIAPVGAWARDIRESSPLLELVKEGPHDTLYRVRKGPLIAIDRDFETPVRVSRDQPFRVSLDPLFSRVEIRLDLEAPDGGHPRTWFQIDWKDPKTAAPVGGFKEPLSLEPGRATHEHVRRIARERGTVSVLTVASADGSPILLHGVRVTSRPVDGLAPLLEEYGRTPPRIAKRLD